MADRKHIRIAIIGGGIAGLCLALGLNKHAHIQFDLYDSAPSLTDAGFAINFGSNALRALEMISPELRESIDVAGAVKMVTMLHEGDGPNAGKFITSTGHEFVLNVHRAEWLEQLVNLLPSSTLHTSKKLASVEETNNEVLLRFVDGTEARVDAVIGCDGIHSLLRKAVLGANHPAVQPVFAGYFNYINVVPVELAREKMGENLTDYHDGILWQMSWTAPGKTIITDRTTDGKQMQLIGVGTTKDWEYGERERAATREQIREYFANFGKVGEGVSELLCHNRNQAAWPLFQHRDAPTYANGHMCIMGDAAHAMTPWMGAGGGQAIEDALVLETLLGKANGPEQVPAAFQAFDKVRRPRTQDIAARSLETGMMCTGMPGAQEYDVERMRRETSTRWEGIIDADLVAHVDEAVGNMNGLIGMAT